MSSRPRRGDESLWHIGKTDRAAPEPVQVGSTVVTQKSLYLALFVIGKLDSITRPHMPFTSHECGLVDVRPTASVDRLAGIDVLLAGRE